jgi:hypothetical protein
VVFQMAKSPSRAFQKWFLPPFNFHFCIISITIISTIQTSHKQQFPQAKTLVCSKM